MEGWRAPGWGGLQRRSPARTAEAGSGRELGRARGEGRAGVEGEGAEGRRPPDLESLAGAGAIN